VDPVDILVHKIYIFYNLQLWWLHPLVVDSCIYSERLFWDILPFAFDSCSERITHACILIQELLSLILTILALFWIHVFHLILYRVEAWLICILQFTHALEDFTCCNYLLVDHAHLRLFIGVNIVLIMFTQWCNSCTFVVDVGILVGLPCRYLIQVTLGSIKL